MCTPANSTPTTYLVMHPHGFFNTREFPAKRRKTPVFDQAIC